MNVIIVVLMVVAIYIAAYILYGRTLLERQIVKADPNRLTPALEKFDGIDYVPANKYVLYGHHFASIAGAGPIVGPAIAMVWGWTLPLIWVIFGNIFIGAVHDYLATMSSVRYGGVSIMTISENVMGRMARYIFLAYVWFALILVLAAFLSVNASLYVGTPTAATLAILYMVIALVFGVLVYRYGLSIRTGSLIALILIILAFIYSMNVPTVLKYGDWVIVLALYAIIAAALPVWYLLQPRDYLSAYILWAFVALALIGGLLVFGTGFTLSAYTGFAAPGTVIGALPRTPSGEALIAYFWPAVPLVIACGALSGFHSVVGSGTTSKQLANELDALFVGYGAMLTEGAVSTLAVIVPIAAAWNFAAFEAATGAPVSATLLNVANIDVSKTPTLGGLAPAARFAVGYGLLQALAWSKLFGYGAFESLFAFFRMFATWALTVFVLTTLDTANRLARFAWTEFFEWLRPVNESAYKVVTNRWLASIVAVLAGAALAYPQIYVPELKQYVYAYTVVWPAFAGTNQLLAALALLTSALWVYLILNVRGWRALLIMVPALFLWITVTLALIIWLLMIVPDLPLLYKVGAGTVVAVSVVLDILLIVLFVRALLIVRRPV
ncbi:MAG: carbon starvation protein A [Thermoprotei archaeon]|nr:carbon starvation protein A [Thermoprotei archaeon]